MKKAIKLIIGLVTVALIGLIAGAVWLWSTIEQYEGEPVRIYIPAGSDAEAIRDSLISATGEDFGSSAARLWGLMRSRASMAHGSYVVEQGENSWDVARRLRNGRQNPVKVVINNMRTINDLADRVAARLETTPEAILIAIDSVVGAEAEFASSKTYPAAFLPDSYEFYWTEKPENVVATLLMYRNKFWNDERRAKAKALGLTPVEVATLASIVEEESAKREEHGTIARLYLNRLDRDMCLQADPTVKFAIGDFGLRRITNVHLRYDSPYNTYIYKGLPPGPIRIVDKRTIDAVLDAPRHNYLYMCAKEDFSGFHNFAADGATHMANARRYQAALNRRGIR